MKKTSLLIAILISLALASPTQAKTQCQSNPSKGLTSHYRLVDGKKCWYQGQNRAKANLTWEKTNGQTTKTATPSPKAMDNVAAKPTAVVEDGSITGPMMEALRVTQKLVIFSVIQQEATDFAI